LTVVVLVDFNAVDVVVEVMLLVGTGTLVDVVDVEVGTLDVGVDAGIAVVGSGVVSHEYAVS